MAFVQNSRTKARDSPFSFIQESEGKTADRFEVFVTISSVGAETLAANLRTAIKHSSCLSVSHSSLLPFFLIVATLKLYSLL